MCLLGVRAATVVKLVEIESSVVIVFVCEMIGVESVRESQREKVRERGRVREPQREPER